MILRCEIEPPFIACRRAHRSVGASQTAIGRSTLLRRGFLYRPMMMAESPQCIITGYTCYEVGVQLPAARRQRHSRRHARTHLVCAVTQLAAAAAWEEERSKGHS